MKDIICLPGQELTQPIDASALIKEHRFLWPLYINCCQKTQLLFLHSLAFYSQKRGKAFKRLFLTLEYLGLSFTKMHS